MSPHSLDLSTITPFIQLAIAAGLGMLLGIERLLAGKTAGPRTYALVALGACLLTIISLNVATLYPFPTSVDPVPIVSTIVSGIGFIGAGLIIFNKSQSRLSGLTTAAGIWVSAAIGITVGFHFYLLAAFATFLALFIFTIMWRLEQKLKVLFPEKENE
jgi:putative Mg2+ transporter-C (MgtC) family protein